MTNQLNQELNITINPEDLKLPDLDLYLKLHKEVEAKYEIWPDFQVIQDEIVRAINYAKGRAGCRVCDSTGSIDTFRCLNCRGRGYDGYVR